MFFARSDTSSFPHCFLYTHTEHFEFSNGCMACIGEKVKPRPVTLDRPCLNMRWEVCAYVVVSSGRHFHPEKQSVYTWDSSKKLRPVLVLVLSSSSLHEISREAKFKIVIKLKENAIAVGEICLSWIPVAKTYT
jgi:hypothetical protein